MTATFHDLGVPEAICTALTQRGIVEPFEIQAATIADALAGRDVCGRAPTGSGKTLAFGIPLVATVERAAAGRPRALVLAPTRELAEQISAELTSIAGPVRVACVYGGVSYTGQVAALRRGVDVLVACPGRLEDLMAQDLVRLDDVDRVVIDEADRMADMGFLPVVRRLLDRTRTPRQTVLFSATLDGDVAHLTRDYQVDPVRHDIADATPDLGQAEHVFWQTGATNRTELTVEAVNAVWPAIVFTRTRHGSDRLARTLTKGGVDAVAIHGGRSQRQRNQALADFAAGRAQALVATDVAARGIHVDDVALVVHYDLPEDPKDYVHRSGRTARAGRNGVILALVQPADVRAATRLQRQVGVDVPLVEPDAVSLRALSGPVERPRSTSPAAASTVSAAPLTGGDRTGATAASGRHSDDRPRRQSQRRDGQTAGGAAGRRRDGQAAGGRGTQGREDRSGGAPERQRRDGRRPDSGRPDSGPGKDTPSTGRRGGLNLVSRTRAAGRRGAGDGALGSSRATAGSSSAPAARGPKRSATGAGARSGAAAKPTGAGARSGAAAKQAGVGGRSGAAAKPAGAGARTSAKGRSGRSSSPSPGGNRKARRAHLQWS